MRDNLGWHSARVFDIAQVKDGGGNVHIDPKMADPAHNNFTPAYGYRGYGVTAS